MSRAGGSAIDRRTRAGEAGWNMQMLDDLKRRLAFDRKNLGADFVSGLITGIASIPDSMASALLAGISPLTGLYTMIVATPVGALFTSSQMMHISTTSALSLAVGGSLIGVPAEAEAAGRVRAGAHGGRDPARHGPAQDGLPGALRAACGDDRLPERRRRADRRGPARGLHRLPELLLEPDRPRPGHGPEPAQHGPADRDRRRRVHRADGPAREDHAASASGRWCWPWAAPPRSRRSPPSTSCPWSGT